jgi:glycosyltransferase involved in cell wall biosynthesis
MANAPVTFCMSTYRRPEFLESQLKLLLTQTYTDFEIVVSDNDPERSGEAVAKNIGDPRVRYFANGVNLGMIQSFNKSIERAQSQFVVMVTDDDPVDPDFLAAMFELRDKNPGFALYAGFTRAGAGEGEVEKIEGKNFVREILDPRKTPWFLWSSCMMSKEAAGKGIPDYGSPHLADHALIAMAGFNGGGVIINKRFSSLTSHNTNFSKFNFNNYVNGCKGFHKVMIEFCSQHSVSPDTVDVVHEHLYHWFIANAFTLRRFYTVTVPDKKMIGEVDAFAKDILQFEFMKPVKLKYAVKSMLFNFKNATGLLTKK